MQFYEVGRVVGSHGLKGEVKVNPITDFPQLRFKKGSRLYLNSTSALNVATGRPFKQFWLVRFKEIENLDQAEAIKGKMLLVRSGDQQSLPKGSFYYDQIIGLKAVDDDSGKEIGQISDIESTGANDIWEVTEENGRKYWIPYIPSVVKQVDLKRGLVLVTLLKGLRDEN